MSRRETQKAPQAKPRRAGRLDPFRGQVKRYGEFVFVYAMIYGILIAVLLFTGFSALNGLSGRAATLHGRVVMERAKTGTARKDRDDLFLYASGESVPFKVTAYQGYEADWERILDAASLPRAFDVWYEDETDLKEPRYYVRALADENTQYVTLETSDRRIRDTLAQVHAIFTVMLLVWTAIVAASIVVGRNPRRYSPKVRRLFFK